MNDDVPPLVLKPRRRMIQPTKKELRRQIAVAQARIVALEATLGKLSAERPVRAFLLRLWGYR
jgi:hypothetical protein